MGNSVHVDLLLLLSSIVSFGGADSAGGLKTADGSPKSNLSNR